MPAVGSTNGVLSLSAKLRHTLAKEKKASHRKSIRLAVTAKNSNQPCYKSRKKATLRDMQKLVSEIICYALFNIKVSKTSTFSRTIGRDRGSSEKPLNN